MTQAKPALNTAIHGLRGVASVMVLFAHILAGGAEHNYADRLDFVEGTKGFWNFGTYGVYLFFAISGFVILPSILRYDVAEFAKRRFVRIYPLFFVMTVLFVILNAVTNKEPQVNDPLSVVAGFTFTNMLVGTEQLTPNAWSLTYEAMFYVLATAVITFMLKAPNRFFLMIAVALSVAFLLFFPASIFFLVGVGTRIAHDRGYNPRGGWVHVAEALAAVALIYAASQDHFAYKPSEIGNSTAQLIIFCTAAYFFLAARPDSLTGRILSANWILFLGTISYSLYLVHPYVYLPVRLLFERFGLFGENIALSMGLFYIAVIIPTLAVTYVFHVTLESWPYKAVFHRGVFTGRSERQPTNQ